MAAQTQAQLDDEAVLNHILQMIMVFPTDSDAGQALNAAGVMSVKDLLLDGDMFTQLTFMAGMDEKKLKFFDVAKLRKFFPFHLALCERDAIFRFLTMTGTTFLTTTGMSTVSAHQLSLWEERLHQLQWCLHQHQP